MSHNTFGHLFRLTTWGESHGLAIGGVIDGCPPGIKLDVGKIQAKLDRRRPGRSSLTSQRREPDKVKLLSGVTTRSDIDGLITTGAPIAVEIANIDARSNDYDENANKYRPGHADYSYQAKYAIRDIRGGGRSSARETAIRVAAGAIAAEVIPDITVRAALVQLGTCEIDRANWDWQVIDQNPFFCPDPQVVDQWQDYLTDIRRRGSSVGAIIEIVAENVPAGLGAPIYGKLDQDIAAGLMSINAVKGVEIGAGFSAAGLTGEQNGDEMTLIDGRVGFLSNNAGGILGGISSGAPIIARFAVKPTSSILIPLQTINNNDEEVEIVTRGRHDPCVGVRAPPIGEAMMTLVLADHFLRHRGQVG